MLLRNDGVLPLPAGAGSVALIGPNAHQARHLFGDYTYPAHIEALEDMRRSGQNVFSIPFSDGASLEVLVGSSSSDLVEAGSVTIVPDPSGRAPVKAFDGSVTISS